MARLPGQPGLHRARGVEHRATNTSAIRSRRDMRRRAATSGNGITIAGSADHSRPGVNGCSWYARTNQRGVARRAAEPERRVGRRLDRTNHERRGTQSPPSHRRACPTRGSSGSGVKIYGSDPSARDTTELEFDHDRAADAGSRRYATAAPSELELDQDRAADTERRRPRSRDRPSCGRPHVPGCHRDRVAAELGTDPRPSSRTNRRRSRRQPSLRIRSPRRARRRPPPLQSSRTRSPPRTSRCRARAPVAADRAAAEPAHQVAADRRLSRPSSPPATSSRPGRRGGRRRSRTVVLASSRSSHRRRPRVPEPAVRVLL